MICLHCNKICECHIVQTLYSMSNDFCINNCKNYDEMPGRKYIHIAEHDDLMALVYDYFTGNLKYDINEDEAKEAITRAMWNL